MEDNLTNMGAKVSEIIQRSVQILENNIASYMATKMDEQSQQILELKLELDTSNRYREVFRMLDQESTKEKENLKAEIVKLKEKNAMVGQNLDRRVVCLIDGDGYIFSRSLISQGQNGGRAAAAKLVQSIQDFMSPDNYQLHVYVFLHKHGLINTFKKCGLEDAARGLEDFITGFNQSAERFIFLDVGGGKEAVDSKLRAYLEDEVKSVQTTKVIFGGSHNNGYVNTLQSLITAGHEKKLVLLQGYQVPAARFKSLSSLSHLNIPELFEAGKLESRASPVMVPASAVSSSPAIPPGLGLETSKTFTTQWFTSIPSSAAPVGTYKSALQITPGLASKVQSWRGPPSPPRTRRIDPNKPLSKHDPAPCNIFYLTQNCKFGDKCAFAHDYELTLENIKEMRELAKKSPCAAVRRGEICPFGEQCCYGHKCTFMKQCLFLKLGTCKFDGVGMHSVQCGEYLGFSCDTTRVSMDSSRL